MHAPRDNEVILKTLTSAEWDPSGVEPVPVTVNGWPGYTSFGGNFSDDTADQAIIWQTEHRSGSCNTLVLVHWDPGVSIAPGLEEITKMALSFIPSR